MHIFSRNCHEHNTATSLVTSFTPIAVTSFTLTPVTSFSLTPVTSFELTPVDGHEEHGTDEDKLYVDELERVNGRDAEGRRLLVGVVQLVEVLVQERRVVQPVRQVGEVVLKRVRESVREITRPETRESR